MKRLLIVQIGLRLWTYCKAHEQIGRKKNWSRICRLFSRSRSRMTTLVFSRGSWWFSFAFFCRIDPHWLCW